MIQYIRYLLIIFLLLDALLQFLISSRTSNVDLLRPLLYLQALLPFIFSSSAFLLFSRRSHEIRHPFLTRTNAAFLCLVLFYFVMSTFMGLFIAPNPINSFLDLIRGLSPFIVFLSIVMCLTDRDDPRRVVNEIVSVLFIYTYGLLIAKIVLSTGGRFYGGGAYQFQIPTVLLVILFWLSSSQRDPLLGLLRFLPKSLFARTFLLMVLVAFTILSFKRENWVILAVGIAFGSLAASRNRHFGQIVAVALIFIVIFLSLQSDIVDQLLNRFRYTFSGGSGFTIDRSSFERIAEIRGVVYTLGQQMGPLEFLVGHGNGAEFILGPGYLSAKDQTGSAPGYYRHVHSMYFILLMRNGLIGVCLYIAPIVAVLFIFGRRLFRRKDSIRVMTWALFAHALTLLISGLAANSAYGSFSYGLFLILALAVYRIPDYDNRSH